jgi:hypothetical protein
LLHSFLPSVILLSVIFYLQLFSLVVPYFGSFCSFSHFYLRSFSTIIYHSTFSNSAFCYSTFGYSTLGHSTFGHSMFGHGNPPYCTLYIWTVTWFSGCPVVRSISVGQVTRRRLSRCITMSWARAVPGDQKPVLGIVSLQEGVRSIH